MYYREFEYYTKLNILLKKYELNDISPYFYQKTNLKAQKISEQIAFDYTILDKIAEIFPLIKKESLKNTLCTNGCMAYYWQMEFAGQIDYTKIRMSLYFTLLCCTLDIILDSSNYESAYTVINNYDWVYIRSFLEEWNKIEESSVVDTIMNIFSELFHQNKDKCSQDEIDHIIHEIEISIKSEIFVSNRSIYHLNPNIEVNSVCGKSVQFSRVGMYLAIMGSGRICSKLFNSMECFGDAFMLIDDIIDLYDDIKCEDMNYLLYDTKLTFDSDQKIIEGIDIIIDSMEKYISRIRNNLDFFKENTGSTLYTFVKFRIFLWTLPIINKIMVNYDRMFLIS